MKWKRAAFHVILHITIRVKQFSKEKNEGKDRLQQNFEEKYVHEQWHAPQRIYTSRKEKEREKKSTLIIHDRRNLIRLLSRHFHEQTNVQFFPLLDW